MDFNGEMEQYLHQRKRSSPGWWSKMFTTRQAPPEDLPPEEAAKLVHAEEEIRAGEAKLEAAPPEVKPELEAQQEERVSFYQRMRRLFANEEKLETEMEKVVVLREQTQDDSVKNDFRALAEIQVRWLGRLPSRIKEEFRNSEDYKRYREILTRRGIVKE